MANSSKKPKEKTVVRTNPFGGNQRTITKSKSVDAQGTATKTRSVTRKVLTDRTALSSTKSKIKAKYANGVTRKIKGTSSTETAYRQPSENKFKRKTTTSKERISGKGIVSKLKSLARPSHKQGHSSTSYGGEFFHEDKMGYGPAKKRTNQIVKDIKKG
jgi:hypothetical protein